MLMTVACQERILVIEDEEDIAFIVKTRLESAGYEVQTAAYGATGLSAAIAHHPDLVILDVRLPDLGGYEVCQELRKLYSRSEMPVLMFTVMNGPIDDIQGFAAGADAYLNKECSPAELLGTIEQLLTAEPLPA